MHDSLSTENKSFLRNCDVKTTTYAKSVTDGFISVKFTYKIATRFKIENSLLTCFAVVSYRIAYITGQLRLNDKLHL